MSSTEPDQRRLGLRLAPYVLWFGTLGGITTWSLHTIVLWSFDEITCRAHSDAVRGVPLRPLLGGLTAFFLLITFVALIVSYRHWQRFRGEEGEGVFGLRQQRARMMALVGLILNGLSLLMIVLDGFAILILPACAS